jgi:hypothetical protein
LIVILWLDQKIIQSNLQKNYLVIFFAKLLEKRSASKASAVSTLTSAVYPVLRSRHPKMTSKHSVIPTCTDLNKFAFSPSLPSEKTLLLSGVFNNYYDLEVTRRFIQKCKESFNVSVIFLSVYFLFTIILSFCSALNTFIYRLNSLKVSKYFIKRILHQQYLLTIFFWINLFAFPEI